MTVLLPPYVASRHPSAPLSSASRAKRRRVLVVDDELALGEGLRAVLEPHHEVEVETSAASARARLDLDAAFDVILCDVMMPGASGLDLLDHVRARHPTLATRFLLMTGGILDESLRERAAQSRAPCLEKPMSTSELLEAIARAMRAV